MATVQDVINRAAERSNLNDVSIMSEAELIAEVSANVRNILLFFAKVNPEYFSVDGNTAARGSSTASWAISTTPGNIGALIGVEIAAITGTVPGLSVGDTVNLVSKRRPWTEPAPRVYVRVGTLLEYNQELQADSSNYVTTLKLTYSFVSSNLTATTDAIATPNDDILQLYVLKTAQTMALRDQRPEEAALIAAEFEARRADVMSTVEVHGEGTVQELVQGYSAIPSIGK